ncbi:MAG: hypothetical protein HC844_14880 [Tabrizicola sp.]|nr:hypothetical protein [Tabrizicola sp.]
MPEPDEPLGQASRCKGQNDAEESRARRSDQLFRRRHEYRNVNMVGVDDPIPGEADQGGNSQTEGSRPARPGLAWEQEVTEDHGPPDAADRVTDNEGHARTVAKRDFADQDGTADLKRGEKGDRPDQGPGNASWTPLSDPKAPERTA